MTHPVVTVTLDGREILRLDRSEARVVVTAFDDQTRIAAALGQAIGVFLAHQPAMTDLAVAADAVSRLAAAADPVLAGPGVARIAESITDLGARIAAGSDCRPTH